MRWPLLALFCARAYAWVARQHAVMGLHEWRADVTQWGTKPARLGCLPMPLGQELLVGERAELALSEGFKLDLLRNARDACASVFAAIVVMPSGNEIAQHASLLQVVAQDWQAEGLSSFEVEAVGRVQLSTVTRTRPFLEAEVCEVRDSYETAANLATRDDSPPPPRSRAPTSAELYDSLVEVRGSVCALTRKLEALRPSRAQTDAQHDAGLPPAAAMEESVDDFIESIYGAAPVGDALRLEMRSWAAMRGLEPITRVRALDCLSTGARLQMANAELKERQARLAAQLALADLRG